MENTILSHIDFQINKCKHNFHDQKSKPILNNTYVKEALEKMKHNFVVLPFDMAANNVSFICKKFYATTLLKESRVIGTPSKTYELISDYNKKFNM